MAITTVSAFQQHFPLHPWKFWKKFLPQLIKFGLISLVIVFMGAFFALGNEIGYDRFSQRNPFFGVFFLLAALFFIVTVLSYIWYIRVYIRRYYYDASDSFVTIKKGVFAPAEIHVQYTKIQDVYVDQDILDRIMGLYDVHIASATITSGLEAHIDGVGAETAEGLKNFLLEKIRVNGTGGARQSITDPPSMPNQPPRASTDAQLNEDVSNIAYPIEGRWILLMVCTEVQHSLWLISLFLAFSSIRILIDKNLAYSISSKAGLAGLVAIVLGFLYSAYFIARPIYLVFWKKNYRFAFTPEHIFVREGVIAKSEKHIPYNTVQDVLVNQSILERLFGLASVLIQNAAGGVGLGGGGITIPGQTLERANKLAEIVKTVVLSKHSARTGL